MPALRRATSPGFGPRPFSAQPCGWRPVPPSSHVRPEHPGIPSNRDSTFAQLSRTRVQPRLCCSELARRPSRVRESIDRHERARDARRGALDESPACGPRSSPCTRARWSPPLPGSSQAVGAYDPSEEHLCVGDDVLERARGRRRRPRTRYIARGTSRARLKPGSPGRCRFPGSRPVPRGRLPSLRMVVLGEAVASGGVCRAAPRGARSATRGCGAIAPNPPVRSRPITALERRRTFRPAAPGVGTAELPRARHRAGQPAPSRCRGRSPSRPSRSPQSS
jgi:hypothetical protein